MTLFNLIKKKKSQIPNVILYDFIYIIILMSQIIVMESRLVVAICQRSWQGEGKTMFMSTKMQYEKSLL